MKDIGDSLIYQMEPKYNFLEITNNTLNFPKFYTQAPKVIGLGQNALKTSRSYSKHVLTLKLSWYIVKTLRKKMLKPINYYLLAVIHIIMVQGLTSITLTNSQFLKVQLILLKFQIFLPCSHFFFSFSTIQLNSSFFFGSLFSSSFHPLQPQ